MAALDAEPEKFIQSVILFIAIALIMSLISFATKGGVGMAIQNLSLCPAFIPDLQVLYQSCFILLY